MEKIRLISCLLFIILVIPSVHALTVISTTTVLWDPIQYIGGEKVQAIYIADPTICPHLQAHRPSLPPVLTTSIRTITK